MAISRVGYVLATTGGGTAGTLAVTPHGSSAEGDVLVIIVMSDDTGTAAEFTAGVGSNLTKLDEGGVPTNYGAHCGSFYKVLGSGDYNTSVSIDAASSDEMMMYAITYRGVDTTSPIGNHYSGVSISDQSYTDISMGPNVQGPTGSLVVKGWAFDGGEAHPFNAASQLVTSGQSGTGANDVSGGFAEYRPATTSDVSIRINSYLAIVDGWADVKFELKQGPNYAETVGLVGGAETINTYYFDASQLGPIDNTHSGIWVNANNAFDGSLATFSYNNDAIAASSYLYADGTNAPGTGGAILKVRMRAYTAAVESAVIDFTISTTIYAQVTNSSTTPAWSNYVTAGVPDGDGWTWSKLQTNVRIWFSTSVDYADVDVYRAELEVTAAALDYTGAIVNGQSEIVTGSASSLIYNPLKALQHILVR